MIHRCLKSLTILGLSELAVELLIWVEEEFIYGVEQSLGGMSSMQCRYTLNDKLYLRMAGDEGRKQRRKNTFETARVWSDHHPGLLG